MERKIQTVADIIRKVDSELTTFTPNEIVPRAIFMSIISSETNILSSFQLVGGCQPSLLSISSTVVSSELLDSHLQQVALQPLRKRYEQEPVHMDALKYTRLVPISGCRTRAQNGTKVINGSWKRLSKLARNFSKFEVWRMGNQRVVALWSRLMNTCVSLSSLR